MTQSTKCGILSKGRGANGHILECIFEGAAGGGGLNDDPADTETGHAPIFGEAGNDNDVWELGGGWEGMAGDAVIYFVNYEPDGTLLTK